MIAAAAAAFAFSSTAIILKRLIPVLKSRKMGQKIYDIGPRWHKSKEGTPIMGGLAFIASVSFLALVLTVLSICLGTLNDAAPVLITVVMAVLNGAIGFVDDSTKLLKKQNKGISAKQKLVLQFAVAIVYVAVMRLLGYISTDLYFPYFDKSVNLGFGYYVLAVLIIVGVVNAVNLTDGIDGLASSVSCVYSLLFCVCGVVNADTAMITAAAATAGGTAGFLVYNFYPARIFMGDTGSLFLGGMVVGLPFALRNPLIVFMAGIVFIIEAASVILQVGYFKITHGKRIFKMAPIHHHFEKCGWSEIKIVAVFTAVAAAAAVAAWFGL